MPYAGATVPAGTGGVTLVAEGIWAILSVRPPPGHELDRGAAVSCAVRKTAAEIPRYDRDRHLSRQLPPDTRRTLFLEMAGPVDVLLFAGAFGFPSRRAALTIPERNRTFEHVLELPARTEYGSLRVIVRDPEGEPMPGSRITLSFDWLDEVGHEAINVSLDENGRYPWISPGRYRVRVFPGAEEDPTNFILPVLLENEVEIAAGEETVLEVAAGELGGRLQIRCVCDGPTNPPDPEEDPPLPCHASVRGSVFAKGGPEALEFVDEAGWLTYFVPMGSTVLCRRVLQDGEYEVMLTPMGEPCHDVDLRTVHVAPGEITFVEVVFTH